MGDMILRRGFQVSAFTLDELDKAGLDARLVAALQRHRGGRTFTRKELLALLAGVAGQPLSTGERRLILRHSRLSLLRLERIIPNRSLREWVEALVFALLVAVVVRTFLFAPFKIPSGSMIPTIEIGDHIFASMYSYGVPVPFTRIKIFPQQINRGDIVIFPFPLDPSIDYIKRVIARGGETVEVRGTKVFVDGVELVEPYAMHDPATLAERERQGAGILQYGPEVVPEGHLFVMGDNRLNSSDSRVWGFVDAGTVKGRGQIIYWSHHPDASWFSGYRWGRIGALLH